MELLLLTTLLEEQVDQHQHQEVLIHLDLLQLNTHHRSTQVEELVDLQLHLTQLRLILVETLLRVDQLLLHTIRLKILLKVEVLRLYTEQLQLLRLIQLQAIILPLRLTLLQRILLLSLQLPRIIQVEIHQR